MRTAIAIRHVGFEDAGTLGDALVERGYELRYVEAGSDHLARIDPLAPDLLVVLGGPIGAYEEDLYPFLTDELRLAERRMAADLPMVGICLGAQIMARALGARVYPGQTKEIGWSPLDLTAEGMASCCAPLAAEHTSMLHWHGDTFDLPAGATLLASTAITPNQIYRWGQGALAIQCHPEFKRRTFEHWLIGHACELSTAGSSPVTLRAEAARLGAALERQGRLCFDRWLDAVQL